MQAPDWWFTATGIFSVLGSIAMLVTVVMLALLFRILLDLRSALQNLNKRVDTLTQKVETITDNVKDVTTEVGARAKGITRVVDQHASTAFDIVEKVAPILVGIGVVGRIISLIKKGK